MQLDVFTPLKDGPLPVEEIATATGVNTQRLERLLYILVVAGALTVKDKRFSNTPAEPCVLSGPLGAQPFTVMRMNSGRISGKR